MVQNLEGFKHGNCKMREFSLVGEGKYKTFKTERAIWAKPDSMKGELGWMREILGEKPGNGRHGAVILN